MCLLDPHGDLTRQVIGLVPPERRDDVLLLDAGNEHVVFGLNLLEADGTPRGVARTADAVVHSFKRAWGSLGWGARLEMTLYNLAYALASAGKTLADVPDFFYRGDARRRVLAEVDNRNVVDFWHHEYDALTPAQQRELRSSTFNKIKLFLDNPLVARIVGQPRSSVDWRSAMDQGRIVLVRLPEGEIGEGAVNLLGSTIVDQIAGAVRSRADVPEDRRRPFFLFADEFHRFATPAFAKLLDELRKYGIATLMAHQRRAQLGDEAREAALGARNFVVFEVTARDAAELGREFSSVPDETFAGLKPFTARVKLRQGRQTIECGIRTVAPEPPAPGWTPQPVGVPVEEPLAAVGQRRAQPPPETASPAPVGQVPSPSPHDARRRIVIRRDEAAG